MDPSSGYTVPDIDNHETTNFMAMWQDTQPLHFSLPEEMLFWDHAPLINNGLVGITIRGGTTSPVIDLTVSTPEPSRSPNGSPLGSTYMNSASYSPSESSHLLRQGETPSTIEENNRPFESQGSTASCTDINRHLLKYVLPF